MIYKLNLESSTDLTLYALGDSKCFETESAWTVSVNAGHGELCLNFCLELNSS
jgi:hypothetical protein